MPPKEAIMREYFRMWLEQDGSALSEIFAEDVRYSESWGPSYRGLDEIRRWFGDWSQRDRVLKWRMKRMLDSGSSCVCEWYFVCRCDGAVRGFNGVTWADFNGEGKISVLKEFQSAMPNSDPYGNGPRGRLAREEDLPRVLGLFSGAVRLMRARGIEQWDEIYPDGATLAADIRNGEMFLLTEGEEPVSAVVLNGEQMEEYRGVPWEFEGGDIAVIHRLCVGAEQQGRGLGKAALRFAEDLLREQGYRIVRLDAFSKNPAALKLYESSGYRRAGEVAFRTGLFYCYEKKLCPAEKSETEGTAP